MSKASFPRCPHCNKQLSGEGLINRVMIRMMSGGTPNAPQTPQYDFCPHCKERITPVHEWTEEEEKLRGKNVEMKQQLLNPAVIGIFLLAVVCCGVAVYLMTSMGA